jgi:hypothetical protein
MSRKFGIELECIGGAITMQAAATLIKNAGVACEVESYNHIRRDHWKIVTDGSLVGRNPFELVSPPLAGEEGIEQVRKAVEALRAAGVGVNQTCGFHVHVDAAKMQAAHFNNLAKLVTIHERHMKRVLPVSRQNNNYARFPSVNFGGRTVEQICDLIDACPTVGALTRMWGNRFNALNLDALSRHGTVEFRAHSGSLDAQKIAAWVSLCIGLVRRAVSSEVVAPRRANGRRRNWQDFIRGAGREHLAYFLKRWEDLGGNTGKVHKGRAGRAKQLAAKAAAVTIEGE